MMFQLRRRAALAWRHGGLLVHCVLIVLLIRLALLLTGYQPLLRRMSRARVSPGIVGHVHLGIWGIRHAARLVPGATCLTRALAAHYLCIRAGHPTLVRIGVRRRDDGTVGAHAWLVDDDCVLIGGQEEDLGRFTPLVDLQGTAR